MQWLHFWLAVSSLGVPMMTPRDTAAPGDSKGHLISHFLLPSISQMISTQTPPPTSFLFFHGANVASADRGSYRERGKYLEVSLKSQQLLSQFGRDQQLALFRNIQRSEIFPNIISFTCFWKVVPYLLTYGQLHWCVLYLIIFNS